MKISIITVAFNSATTIRDTLESVLNQDHDDVEYIVVDGNSQDDTLSILEEYKSRFEGKMKYISEPDKGIYDAMNKGLALTSGDVVGILNADDFYSSGYILSTVAEYFMKYDCDGIYGDLDFISSDNIHKVVRRWKSSPYKKGAFRKGWHPPHPTFFVKKEIYRKYGNFDTSLNVSADFELMLRFIERYEINVRYIPQIMIKMRYGGESTGSWKKILEGNRNILKAFKKNQLKVNEVNYVIFRALTKTSQFLVRVKS